MIDTVWSVHEFKTQNKWIENHTVPKKESFGWYFTWHLKKWVQGNSIAAPFKSKGHMLFIYHPLGPT